MANSQSLPTMAGRKELLNIAAGRGHDFGVSGMSAHGGHRSTMLALTRKGFVGVDGKLTEAGHEMVRRLTVVPEVRHD